GSANALDKIIVRYNGETKRTTVSGDGQWQITFTAKKAGGPYKLTIDSNKSGKIDISKVYIGEVWLASGQSNMDFKLRDERDATSILRDSLNTNVFLFSMDPKAQTNDRSFTKEELQNCNTTGFFEPSGWSNMPGTIMEQFSAIGYSFAYHLQKKLNVPVGIICNAVGGATTQSWISREAMEADHETIDLLNDTHLTPLVPPCVNQRREKNVETRTQLGIRARHPFDPTMLFDAGIFPLSSYPINGVIWYQGESNAERKELHSKL